MRFALTQDFNRIEAVHTARSDPADPVWLHVVVTDAADLDTIIESALMEGVNPLGVTPTRPDKHPWRLFTGTWGYELEPDYYEQGKQYTIHWRHAMAPDNMGSIKHSFIWQAPEQSPRDPANCILWGKLATVQGVPVPISRIVIEQYRDHLTRTHRINQVTVMTDVFGLWWLEVPRGSIQRVIFGELAKVVVIPDANRAALKDLADWQPDEEGVRKDAFGYPYPVGGESSTKPYDG